MAKVFFLLGCVSTVVAATFLFSNAKKRKVKALILHVEQDVLMYYGKKVIGKAIK
jgi:hypothetical protein